MSENTCTLVGGRSRIQVLNFFSLVSFFCPRYSARLLLANTQAMLYVVDTNIPLKRSSQNFKATPCRESLGIQKEEGVSIAAWQLAWEPVGSRWPLSSPASLSLSSFFLSPLSDFAVREKSPQTRPDATQHVGNVRCAPTQFWIPESSVGRAAHTLGRRIMDVPLSAFLTLSSPPAWPSKPESFSCTLHPKGHDQKEACVPPGCTSFLLSNISCASLQFSIL